jgi:hypothetical protein
MSPIVRAAQTGLTQNYALVMVIGLLCRGVLFLQEFLVSEARPSGRAAA